MANAISLLAREKIIELYKTDMPLKAICGECGVSYGSVKTLIKRYKMQGLKGIAPRYAACGRKRDYNSECSYRLVRLYKRYHTQWGVSYILMKIKDKYPHLPLLCSRVYERRLKADNQITLEKNPPLQFVYHVQGARVPHETWQIDAKERLTTLDTKAACYLTISDEKTGCALEAHVFPLQPN
jgi:hypothetical protein